MKILKALLTCLGFKKSKSKEAWTIPQHQEMLKQISPLLKDSGLQPNQYSIKTSAKIARQFKENGFVPAMVTNTVEGGVCFVFKNDTQFLYLEIYNDGETGMIIEDYKTKKVLKNKSLRTRDIVPEINCFLYKQTISPHQEKLKQMVREFKVAQRESNAGRITRKTKK